jgi:hypothetical protein
MEDFEVDEFDGSGEEELPPQAADLLDDVENDEFEDINFEALGIDPAAPTHAKPGSEEKVLMLTARFAAGLPLWHERDCRDHGPGEAMERLFRQSPAK